MCSETSIDISIVYPKSDIHTWIYLWIHPWISISTATHYSEMIGV